MLVLDTGGVLSSLIVTEAELLSPATLVAEHVTTVPAVSVEIVVAVHPVLLAMPENAETAQVTVTLLLFQPAVLGVGLTVGTMTGGVVSTLIPLIVAGALTLSATSVQVPLAV